MAIATFDLLRLNLNEAMNTAFGEYGNENAEFGSSEAVKYVPFDCDRILLVVQEGINTGDPKCLISGNNMPDLTLTPSSAAGGMAILESKYFKQTEGEGKGMLKITGKNLLVTAIDLP